MPPMWERNSVEVGRARRVLSGIIFVWLGTILKSVYCIPLLDKPTTLCLTDCTILFIIYDTILLQISIAESMTFLCEIISRTESLDLF